MPIVGVSNLHYALLTDDDENGASYSAPVRMVGAIEIDIKPSVESATLFADDGPAETASTLGEIEVTINLADLPHAAQAAVLGHTLGADGVLLAKSTDSPPYLAIGFEALKANGKKRFVWLPKGKFQLPEENYKTKGENVEFQTPSITAKFVKRVYDTLWKKTADEDNTGYVSTTGDNWYTAATLNVPAA